MKIFKRILFSVLAIVTLLLVVAIIFLIILYDGSSIDSDFDKSKSYKNVDEIIGDSFSNSIDNIYNSKADSIYSDNKINITITEDELDNYVIELVRNNINKNYLKDEFSINKSNSVEVNSLNFLIGNDSITIRTRITFLSFYKTKVDLISDAKIEDGKLKFTFNEIKLGGKIGISRGFVKNTLNALNIKLNDKDSEIFKIDSNNLALYLNFDELLESYITNQLIANNIKKLDYTVKASTDGLFVSIDTNKLFKPTTLNTYPAFNNLEFRTEANNKLLVTNPNTIDLYEETFNKLINDSYNDVSDDYNLKNSFKIGKKDFSVLLYDVCNYDLSNLDLKTKIELSNSKSDVDIPLIAKTSIDTLKDSLGNVSDIVVKIESIKLNEIENSVSIFNEIKIPIDKLTNNEFYVTDLELDKENEKLILSIKK